MASYKSREIGSDYLDRSGETDTRGPVYAPGVGQSADEAAKERGLRILGRREPSAGVVAFIALEGRNLRCVRL